MKTTAEIVRWRARLQPDQTAIYFEGQKTSYAELDRRSSVVANALIRAGLEPGQHVCVLDQGHDRFFDVIFGIVKAGGIFTPVNWRLAPPEIAFVLDDAEAPILFVGGPFEAAVQQIEGDLAHTRTIVSFGEGGDGWSSFEAFVAGASDEDPRLDGGDDDTAWQLYTSGTTGHPKGAELTNRNLCAIASAGLTGFGNIAPGHVGLVCMPLYHIGGSGYALCLLFGGCTLVVTREANPPELLKLIAEQKVNHAFFVPALLNMLLQQPACKDTDFSSLGTIAYGASPIPEDLLVRSIQTFGCDFIQAYGLTETTGAVVLLPAQAHTPGDPRLRSCGMPGFGVDLKILDEDGKECPEGEVGEIVIRSDMVMKGYWKRPEATAEAVRDGWFHSGDAGYMRDGYLYIHDRVKDMIVSGGENVYPAEVESMLFGHPDIADVAVIGVPDERWGETVKAVVVLRPGATLDEDTLLEWARGRIAGYKRPRSVDFIDALPRNPTGKILKRELRAPYWEGRERNVN